jgi:hypothetical protein
MSSLTVLRTGSDKFIDFVNPLHKFSADSFMISNLLLHPHLTFNIGYDLRMHEIVSTCSLLDALHQRMVDQSFHDLLPFPALREDLMHHFAL